jgi:hypothetical protein
MSKQPYSRVDHYEFNQDFSDNNTYVKQAGLKGIKLFKYRFKVWLGFMHAEKRLKESISKGFCYYGPFKGEFGHFTAHTLPFLMFLHKQGVKIIYCGMELHKPFMVDEQGNSIIHEFRPLRDFFAEVGPRGNSTVPPKDVQEEIKKFENEANTSGLPFWNIGDDFYYWFVHRNWLLKNHTHIYHIDKYYKTNDENACCIFPRSKGAAQSHNNGGPWDYVALIDLISPYFDKIYICGHPSQVKDLNTTNSKVEIAVSTDNRITLEKVSNSKLIITQHSGVNNVGEYVNTQVLIIYKGGNKVTDIGSMNNTLRFRKSLENKYPLKFAFSEEEIVNFVKEHNQIKK